MFIGWRMHDDLAPAGRHAFGNKTMVTQSHPTVMFQCVPLLRSFMVFFVPLL